MYLKASEKLEGEYPFYLKEGTIPKVHQASLRDKLNQELDRIEQEDIIEKVATPTEWVNSMIAVEMMDGSMRIRIDPIELNKTIMHPFYPIPILEDTTTKLQGAEYFRPLIYGATIEEHGKHLLAILERARLVCVMFNKEKCKFRVSSVQYFRHVVSVSELQPDPKKLRSINKMPSLTNNKELATPFSMLKFLAKYIPNLS
ncbi:hypothetical protein QYM36_011852 [Artemia franciscana]|uniref:Uncharacterized protein n=1 Tax=Artemia franciscana TaxID=6661 RepID=A0AA88HSI3_ARTSF|nr:hypothetical protein QYM36_011852 [Artemia franciscana]